MTCQGIVYTAIFGDKDHYRLLPPAADGWTNILITDADVGGFMNCEVIVIDSPDKGLVLRADGTPDTRRSARRCKLLAHRLFPDAPITIWMDGNIGLAAPIQEVIDAFRDADLMVHRHRWRQCAYDEARACIRAEHDSKAVLDRQVERYRSEGYPRKNGLGETMVVVRRNTPAIADFNELWWKELSENSCRDQVSFDFCCWKLGLRYKTFAQPIDRNKLFKCHPHKH